MSSSAECLSVSVLNSFVLVFLMIVQSWDCWNLDTKLSCQIDPQGVLKLNYKTNYLFYKIIPVEVIKGK